MSYFLVLYLCASGIRCSATTIPPISVCPMSEPFTNEQKFRAAVREIHQRERVYPRLVAGGKMKQGEADFQIAVMRSIATDYERLADKERLI